MQSKKFMISKFPAISFSKPTIIPSPYISAGGILCTCIFINRIDKKLLLTYKVCTKMIMLMWWQRTGGNNCLPSSTHFLRSLLSWTTIESSFQVPQQNFTHVLLMLPKQTTQTNWRGATTSVLNHTNTSLTSRALETKTSELLTENRLSLKK